MKHSTEHGLQPYKPKGKIITLKRLSWHVAGQLYFTFYFYFQVQHFRNSQAVTVFQVGKKAYNIKR
jgi:hypothetical protein